MTSAPNITFPAPQVAAASRATYAAFIGSGFAFASWASRIPQVRDGLELSSAGLGLLLLAIAVGSLIALPLAGLIVHRFVVDFDDGIDLRVFLADPRQSRLKNFCPARLPGADQRGKRACVKLCILRRAHVKVACSDAAASDSLRIASSTVRCRRWNSGDDTMS